MRCGGSLPQYGSSTHPSRSVLPQAGLRVIKPSERHGNGLSAAYYSKNELVAWLTDKLGCPVSPEIKDSREVLEASVRCVLEIMEKEGADHFTSMCATMGALHSWTVDCGKLERHVAEKITDPRAVYDYVRSHLPVIDDSLRYRYMPESFRSTYERSFSLFSGCSIRLPSFCIVPGQLPLGDQKLQGCAVTVDVGASQREGGNKLYHPTLGFVNKAHSGGWILHSPDSDCTCPCGIACAHGLEELHVLSLMQRSISYEAFLRSCPKFDESSAVSSRVIFWDSILYYSAVWMKRSAIASSLAVAAGALAAGATPFGAAAAGTAAAAAVKARKKVGEMSVDERLDELAAAGDALHPETGRTREVYAEFGDAKFFQKLKKLFAAGQPEFNDISYPLYHYYMWSTKDERTTANATAQPQAAAPTTNVAAAEATAQPQAAPNTDMTAAQTTAPAATPTADPTATPLTEPIDDVEPTLQPPSVTTCPAGHTLRRWLNRALNIDCDGCGGEIEFGSMRWSCAPCDYDVCAACTGEDHSASKRPPANSPDRPSPTVTQPAVTSAVLASPGERAGRRRRRLTL
eukprot:5172495-Prymnesium_polylepis.1